MNARWHLAAQAYQSGATLEDLGRDFGVSHVTVWFWLKALGVRFRVRGKLRKPMFELVYLRAHGAGYGEIGARYGLTYQCIRAQLKAIGAQHPVDLLDLNDRQLAAYREALDVDRLSHPDAMDIAKETP